jgi:hypothetical protein
MYWTRRFGLEQRYKENAKYVVVDQAVSAPTPGQSREIWLVGDVSVPVRQLPDREHSPFRSASVASTLLRLGAVLADMALQNPSDPTEKEVHQERY